MQVVNNQYNPNFQVNLKNRYNEAVLMFKDRNTVVPQAVKEWSETCVFGLDAENATDFRDWFLNSFYTMLFFNVLMEDDTPYIDLKFDLTKASKVYRGAINDLWRFVKAKLNKDTDLIDMTENRVILDIKAFKKKKYIISYRFPLKQGWLSKAQKIMAKQQ